MPADPRTDRLSLVPRAHSLLYALAFRLLRPLAIRQTRACRSRPYRRPRLPWAVRGSVSSRSRPAGKASRRSPSPSRGSCRATTKPEHPL